MKVESDSLKIAAPLDREGLIAAIVGVVKKLPEGKPLTRDDFFAQTKLVERDIYRHFPKWSDALLAAGFTFQHWNSAVTTPDLLADWGSVVRGLGRLPTDKEYGLRGEYSYGTMRIRFGGWRKVPDAFREYAKGDGKEKQWKDVLALLPPRGSSLKQRKGRPKTHGPEVRLRRYHRAARLPDRPIYGPPLDIGGLRHAPANEAGVLFLFGAMAKELGFLVDSLQNEFPDCEAKRLIAPDTWQTVRIEFEFQSRNFRDHGHDPAGCDLIVCWEHNWAECPEAIEVIALSDRLNSRHH